MSKPGMFRVTSFRHLRHLLLLTTMICLLVPGPGSLLRAQAMGPQPPYLDLAAAADIVLVATIVDITHHEARGGLPETYSILHLDGQYIDATGMHDLPRPYPLRTAYAAGSTLLGQTFIFTIVGNGRRLNPLPGPFYTVYNRHIYASNGQPAMQFNRSGDLVFVSMQYRWLDWLSPVTLSVNEFAERISMHLASVNTGPIDIDRALEPPSDEPLRAENRLDDNALADMYFLEEFRRNPELLEHLHDDAVLLIYERTKLREPGKSFPDPFVRRVESTLKANQPDPAAQTP